MNQLVKRILLVGGIGAGVVASTWGGLTVFRNVSRKPVSVYPVNDVAMTNYWQDAKEIYGYVTADKLQNVFLSSTETVTQIFVSEGQAVQAGDPLFSFDTTLSDLNVKKAENDLLQKRRSLEKAQALLEKLKKTKPYQEPPMVDPVYPDNPEEPEMPETNPKETPLKLSGSGSAENPLVYLWGADDELNEEFFRKLIGERKQNGYEPDTYEADEPVLIGAVQDPEKPAAAEPNAEGEDGQAEGEADGDVNPDDAAAEPEAPPETTVPNTTTRTKSSDPDAEVYLILERHMDNDPEAETESRWGVRIRRKNGALYTSLFDPSAPLRADEEDGFDDFGDDGGFTGGSSGGKKAEQDTELRYTKEELAQAIQETTKEIRDGQLEVKLAEVQLKKMRDEIGDGTVRAKLDGIVKKVADPEEAYKNSKSFITVSAGGGYIVEVPVSELMLNQFSKGQTVTVTSNETQNMADGTVEALSAYPSSNSDNFFMGSGNPNVSYYPCRIFVDENAEFRENDFVTVTYQSESESGTGDSFYLEAMFIRSDVSGSYVFIQDESGQLKKQKISVGKTTSWGAKEIKQGLTLKDRIAFPYGSNVVDSAKTKDAEIDELYSGM